MEKPSTASTDWVLSAASGMGSLLSAVRDQSLTSLAQDNAHDFRDRLNVILLNVELLARAAETGSAASGRTNAKQSIDLVRRELRRLDRLIDVFVGVRAVPNDPAQSFDLVDVCRRLVELVTPRAVRQQVEVTFDGPGTIRVQGFADEIHQAILCVLINALDAMPEGGRLDVTLSPNGGCQLQICDSGPGISPDHLKNIWRPYFTTKRNRVGLGLHFARWVVESHRGTIRYEPNPEGGSRFLIDLPLHIA